MIEILRSAIKPLGRFLLVLVMMIGALMVFIQLLRESLQKAQNSTIKESKPELALKKSQVFEYKLPKNLSFANEEVPLQQRLVQERLDEVMVGMLYRHANTIMRLKRASRWFPEIEEVLKKNNIPEDFKYLAIVESNLVNLVSVKGATGFWQFMPETARQYGLEVNAQVDERYHPIKSTEAAAKYLKDAFRIFKSWTSVAASYNMGMRGLQIQMQQQKVNSYFQLYLNPETAAYVYHILAVKCIFENPRAYGYQLPKNELFLPIHFKEVTVSTSIPSLVDFALSQKINYDILKEYNPWLKNYQLTVNNPGKSYTILIPKNLNVAEN